MAVEHEPRRAPPDLRSSTSRSRRCGRATTPTPTSTTRARRCSRTAAIRACVMQVFQKQQAVLGGMDEAIAILKLCSHDWDALDRARAPRRRRDRAVGDGDDDRGRLHALRASRDRLPRRARPAHARSRRTSQRVVEAARGKPILFFPARHDHHRVQTGDGYAAHVAGAIGRRSASPRTRRRPGGAAAGSARSRTR